MENGAPSDKVDIVILGDGYAAGDMEKFRKDAQRFNDTMFRTHPFKERKKDSTCGGWMWSRENRGSMCRTRMSGGTTRWERRTTRSDLRDMCDNG